MRKGKRPDFAMAALPEDAKSLIEQIIQRINKADIPVQTGIFGAHMVVDIENDGPVTIMLDSRKVF